MPDSDAPHAAAAQLLKSAAMVVSALGAAFLVWLGLKWQEYPEMQTSQFGYEAPLWPALGTFVLLGLVAIVTLFWLAARRVEDGEDLFAQRHRRKASNWDEQANGRLSE